MKFMFALLSIFSCFATFPAEATISATSCYLYQSASFESDIVKDEDNEVILLHGEKITILEEQENFYLIQTQTDKVGYVYKFYVSPPNDYQIFPTFNAIVRNDNSPIYNIEKEKTTYTANSGDKLYLFEGYNSENEFTAIQIVLEDGTLFNGYMLTEDIAPNGISTSLIVGITIISAVVTIILSLVFIKKKK